MPTQPPKKPSDAYSTTAIRGSIEPVMPVEKQIESTAAGINAGINALESALREFKQKNKALQSNNTLDQIDKYLKGASKNCITHELNLDLAALKQLDAEIKEKMKNCSSVKGMKENNPSKDDFPVALLGKTAPVQSSKEKAKQEKEEAKIDKMLEKLGKTLLGLYEKYHDKPVIAPQVEQVVKVQPGRRR